MIKNKEIYMTEKIKFPEIHLPQKYYELTCSLNELGTDLPITQRIIQRQKYFNEQKGVVAQFDFKTNIIGLLSGKWLKTLCKENKIDTVTQCAKTISHEVFHSILAQEHGYTSCKLLDYPFKDSKSLAIYLKDYGLW